MARFDDSCCSRSLFIQVEVIISQLLDTNKFHRQHLSIPIYLSNSTRFPLVDEVNSGSAVDFEVHLKATRSVCGLQLARCEKAITIEIEQSGRSKNSNKQHAFPHRSVTNT